MSQDSFKYQNVIWRIT